MLANELRLYKLVLDDGGCPIDGWLATLRDTVTRARILRQIDKIERGNLGQHRFFDGIGELKLDFGPGYRIYFAFHGNSIVLLLGGETKSTQPNDIKFALKRFAEWKGAGSLIETLPRWSEPEVQEEEE